MRRNTFIVLSTLLLIIMSTNSNAAVKQAEAIFAGGCFWCLESDFDKVPGVISTQAGYTGGHYKNPSYKQVTHGYTGHFEALKVTFDETQVSYADLLDVFWRNIDPTDEGGQFCDRGNSYRARIFYNSPEQQEVAQASKAKLVASKRFKEVVTPIVAASTFYPAEDYHQNYYKKNPLRYKYYRYSCGRDARLRRLWG